MSLEAATHTDNICNYFTSTSQQTNVWGSASRATFSPTRHRWLGCLPMANDPCDLPFLHDLPCDFCENHSVERRLFMEVAVTRSAAALRSSWPAAQEAAEDLRLATATLKELLRHRQHTAFYKVVAKDPGDGNAFLSIYDGQTRYILGKTVFDQHGGFFVHSSEEQALRSMHCFPRDSAAWTVPRSILLVRGEGKVRLKHGKVLFDGLTPLMELPLHLPGGRSAPTASRVRSRSVCTPWRL